VREWKDKDELSCVRGWKGEDNLYTLAFADL